MIKQIVIIFDFALLFAKVVQFKVSNHMSCYINRKYEVGILLIYSGCFSINILFGTMLRRLSITVHLEFRNVYLTPSMWQLLQSIWTLSSKPFLSHITFLRQAQSLCPGLETWSHCLLTTSYTLRPLYWTMIEKVNR